MSEERHRDLKCLGLFTCTTGGEGGGRAGEKAEVVQRHSSGRALRARQGVWICARG